MNHHESVEWLCSLTDGMVSSILNWAGSIRVNSRVLKRVHPLPSEFDKLFFFVMLAKAICVHLDHDLIDPFPHFNRVHGTNYPDFTQYRWQGSDFVQSGLAAVFVDLIKQNSDTRGTTFDVSFACEIFAESVDGNPDQKLNETTLDYLRSIKGERVKPFFQVLEDGDEIWG